MIKRVLIAIVTALAVIVAGTQAANAATVGTPSNYDIAQLTIAVRYISAAGAATHFNKVAAEAAGVDPIWADKLDSDLSLAIAKAVKVQELTPHGSTSPFLSKASPLSANTKAAASASWWQKLQCAGAIASLIGASIAAVFALFATAGVAGVLIAYGLAGFGVLGACYDEHTHKPIV